MTAICNFFPLLPILFSLSSVPEPQMAMDLILVALGFAWFCLYCVTVIIHKILLWDLRRPKDSPDDLLHFSHIPLCKVTIFCWSSGLPCNLIHEFLLCLLGQYMRSPKLPGVNLIFQINETLCHLWF